MSLKDFILGYRKMKDMNINELAEKLEVPKTVVEGLESGEFRHPNPSLSSKIEKLAEGLDKEEVTAIGRGYRIKEFLGNELHYFLKGLSEKKEFKISDIQKMPPLELYKFIGKVKYDDFIEITDKGKKATIKD